MVLSKNDNVERVKRAHYNDLENIPIFMVLGRFLLLIEYFHGKIDHLKIVQNDVKKYDGFDKTSKGLLYLLSNPGVDQAKYHFLGFTVSRFLHSISYLVLQKQEKFSLVALILSENNYTVCRLKFGLLHRKLQALNLSKALQRIGIHWWTHFVHFDGHQNLNDLEISEKVSAKISQIINLQ